MYRPDYLRIARLQSALYPTPGSLLAPKCLRGVSEHTFGKPQKDGVDRQPLSATTFVTGPWWPPSHIWFFCLLPRAFMAAPDHRALSSLLSYTSDSIVRDLLDRSINSLAPTKDLAYDATTKSSNTFWHANGLAWRIP